MISWAESGTQAVLVKRTVSTADVEVQRERRVGVHLPPRRQLRWLLVARLQRVDVLPGSAPPTQSVSSTVAAVVVPSLI
jgi:hypothetical protein